MPLPPLTDTAVVLKARARDWRDAVRVAGEALQRAGAARASYTDRMVELVEQHGAYIVIAPGLALAHARPGPDVLAEGLSVVSLATPVAFGHPHNDPVSVVVGLAVRTGDRHLRAVAELANVFNDASATRRIAEAATVPEVQAVFAN